MKLGRRRAQVARVAYALYWGRTPQGLYVCHHCDNPMCVRQEHLYLGTPRDNTDDRKRRGRGKNGADVANSKLTEREVLLMREQLAAGASLNAAAAAFGVSKKLALNIKRGTAWAHLLPQSRAA